MKRPIRLMPSRYHLILCILFLAFFNEKAIGTNESVGGTMNGNIRELNNLQQSKTILKGIVKDETGEPIIGASITVEGTTTGTISDIDGNFDINVEPGQIIEISYVGFISQKIKIAGQDFLNIVLVEDTKILGEVVVMGYGTAAKKQDLSWLYPP